MVIFVNFLCFTCLFFFYWAPIMARLGKNFGNTLTQMAYPTSACRVACLQCWQTRTGYKNNITWRLGRFICDNDYAQPPTSKTSTTTIDQTDVLHMAVKKTGSSTLHTDNLHVLNYILSLNLRHFNSWAVQIACKNSDLNLHLRFYNLYGCFTWGWPMQVETCL